MKEKNDSQSAVHLPVQRVYSYDSMCPDILMIECILMLASAIQLPLTTDV